MRWMRFKSKTGEGLLLNYVVRMRFSKTGRAKYISHLDLIRCFQRAVCRAELPATYSGGFHPHMQTSFAATLSLGFTSEAEIMELGLTEEILYDEVMQRLNAVLPTNIRILKAGAPRDSFKDLAYATYIVRVFCDCDKPEELHRSFDKFLTQPEILVQKKTKKGAKEINLKPMLEVYTVREESEGFVIELCLPAGSVANLNPMLVLEAWQNSTEILLKSPQIHRKALLTAERRNFF